MSKPNVQLPRQLQRQQEEVEKFDREIAEAQAAPNPSDPPAEPPQVPDGQEPPPPAPVVAAPNPSDDQWEQRFRTLKGKYDAEVPRLHAELKEMRTKLDELAARPRVETPAEPAKPKSKRVTDKDAETFGADLMDAIKRQAEDIAADALAEMSAKISKLEQENEQLKQTVTGVSTTQAQTTQEMYFAKLTSAVADWQAINVDPKFLEWLGEIDEISGVSRQAHLNHAFENLDVDRTAKLFNAYKKTLPPAPAPAPAKNEVQRQVAPGKSKASPGPTAASAETRIWAQSEISDFYRDFATGKYRTNPQEAARIEAEIDAAVATGRVKA